MHAFVFDIDGTLLDSNSIDGELYVSAILCVLGKVRIRENWSCYRNVTDHGILEEIILDNKIPNGELVIEEVKRTFVKKIELHISQKGPFREIPGAKDFIAWLSGAKDHVYAFATGGWGASARIKLESSGFGVSDVPLSSSDDANDRISIMLNALGKLGESFESVTYFGDGPWDQEASTTLGWEFVPVGRELSGLEHYANFTPNKSFKDAPSGQDTSDAGASQFKRYASKLRKKC